MKPGISANTSPTVTERRKNGVDDDLAQFCLELDPAESKRSLAWVNSVCLAYLIIGIVGLKPPPLPINRRPPPQEEAAAVVIEPLVAAVQAVSADSGESVSEKPTEDAPPGVAVTVDSPEVVFSVPTIGNILVSMNMAQAPPSQPMAGAVPLNMPAIERINVTGVGGSRPSPTYPRESVRDREQGTVELLIEVDESGSVTSVTVKESSGYGRLDRAAMEHVKRTWLFGPSQTKRVYSCPIIFQLR